MRDRLAIAALIVAMLALLLHVWPHIWQFFIAKQVSIALLSDVAGIVGMIAAIISCSILLYDRFSKSREER